MSDEKVARKYTNNTGLSLFAQVFLGTDYYSRGNADVSVTTLIKPTRQVILAGRVPPGDLIIDVEAQIANRIGAAIHDGHERAWKRPIEEVRKTLMELGSPPRVASKVLVNPSQEEIDAVPGCIPCYTEVRFFKRIAGVMVSGQADFIGGGVVEDLKNTGSFKYMNTDGEDYVKQGSMYKLLAPHIITKDHMNVTFNITDWSRMMSRTLGAKGYPPHRMLTKRYELWDAGTTEEWAGERIRLLQEYDQAPETDIPPCTDKELWRGDDQYKYYKKAADAHIPGKRSTKNFDTEREASERFHADGGTGFIKKVPGQVKACLYCAGFSACTQKDALIASGDLVLG
jgi:hypothetical protein